METNLKNLNTMGASSDFSFQKRWFCLRNVEDIVKGPGRERTVTIVCRPVIVIPMGYCGENCLLHFSVPVYEVL